MNKYEVTFRTILFITKAVWFAYAGPREDDKYDEDFIKRHAKNTVNFHKETGPVNLDPRNYFQKGCKYFSNYTPKEELLIWRSSAAAPEKAAQTIWELYKETESFSPLEYKLYILIKEIYYDIKNSKYYFKSKLANLKNFITKISPISYNKQSS